MELISEDEVNSVLKEKTVFALFLNQIFLMMPWCLIISVLFTVLTSCFIDMTGMEKLYVFFLTYCALKLRVICDHLECIRDTFLGPLSGSNTAERRFDLIVSTGALKKHNVLNEFLTINENLKNIEKKLSAMEQKDVSEEIVTP